MQAKRRLKDFKRTQLHIGRHVRYIYKLYCPFMFPFIKIIHFWVPLFFLFFFFVCKCAGKRKHSAPSPKNVLATTFFAFLNLQSPRKTQNAALLYGALFLTLAMNFFSLTLLFWNQIVIWRSDKLVAAEIFLLLSFVMNLLAAYSFSSSLSCTFVYGIRFFLPRRNEPPSCWWATTSGTNNKVLLNNGLIHCLPKLRFQKFSICRFSELINLTM